VKLCVELEGVTTEVVGVVVKTDGLGKRLALRLALTLLVTELEFDNELHLLFKEITFCWRFCTFEDNLETKYMRIAVRSSLFTFCGALWDRALASSTDVSGNRSCCHGRCLRH